MNEVAESTSGIEMNGNGKMLELQFGDISLKLYVDMSIGIGGDKWPAADQFCSLITDVKWVDFFGGIFNNKSILELGSGNGFPGILIDKLYNPSEIVISDLKSHISLISHNMTLNSSSIRTIAEEYDWFNPPLGKSYDVILALEW